jgi:hypothetical protein
MRNGIAIDKLENLNIQRSNALINLESSWVDSVSNYFDLEMLTGKEGENFCEYIEMLGLTRDPNLVVLSSLRHYYYSSEEMISVKTVVNLKELNQIKQIKSFLHSIFHVLPTDCNFIGCFVDNRKQNNFILNNPSDNYSKRHSDDIENGIASSSPFLNMIYSFIDSRTNKYMSEKSVKILLEGYGFRVMDMTEINGLTYFLAKKIRLISE